MRTGLVAVGTALSVVGAAVVAGVLYAGDGPTVAPTYAADYNGLSGGTWGPYFFPASPSNPSAVSFEWVVQPAHPHATAAVEVSLYAAKPCPPNAEPCLEGPALVSWNNSSHWGSWSSTGLAGMSYAFDLTVGGALNASVDFSATFQEQYRAGPSVPLVPLVLTIVGGGLLAGIGALALYLGLFLPAGVYDAPPGPPGEGQDDWDADEPGTLEDEGEELRP